MAFYLIDYENVKNIGPIDTLGDNDSVFFFYTKNAANLTFDLHRAILTSRAKFYYISVEAGGKNALDFQLSTHIGYLVANAPDERYYIISNDTGFDYVISFCMEKYGKTVELIPAIGAKRKTRSRAASVKAAPQKPKSETKKPKSEPVKAEEAPTPKAAPQKKKQAAKDNSPALSPEETVRTALTDAKLNWREKEADIAKIFEILSTAKSKTEINTLLSQYYKDSKTVGRIMRIIRPMTKELP